MISFHGTSSKIATALSGGKVNVTLGGGELGRGFYTGEHLYLAKAWAFHQTGDKVKNVVEFLKPDVAVEALSLELLGHGPAALKRRELRNKGTTQTHIFGVDLVWAPIVGNDRVSGDQFKWESNAAELLLNGSTCVRNVI